MSHDCYVALPRDALGLSAVCDCGISFMQDAGCLLMMIDFKISFWCSEKISGGSRGGSGGSLDPPNPSSSSKYPMKLK